MGNINISIIYQLLVLYTEKKKCSTELITVFKIKSLLNKLLNSDGTEHWVYIRNECFCSCYVRIGWYLCFSPSEFKWSYKTGSEVLICCFINNWSYLNSWSYYWLKCLRFLTLINSLGQVCFGRFLWIIHLT